MMIALIIFGTLIAIMFAIATADYETHSKENPPESRND